MATHQTRSRPTRFSDPEATRLLRNPAQEPYEEETVLLWADETPHVSPEVAETPVGSRRRWRHPKVWAVLAVALTAGGTVVGVSAVSGEGEAVSGPALEPNSALAPPIAEQAAPAPEEVEPVTGAGLSALAGLPTDLTESVPSELTGEELETLLKQSLFVLVARKGKKEFPLCTAFAVSEGLLATNAHCVVQVRKLRKDGVRVMAQRTGASRSDRLITGKGTIHPLYEDAATHVAPDVAVIAVATTGRALTALPLADAQAIDALQASQPLAIGCFPGGATSTAYPVHELRMGRVTRVTDLDLSGHGRRSVLGMSLDVQPGTSGSPVLDRYGRVIALNTGKFEKGGVFAVLADRLAETIALHDPS